MQIPKSGSSRRLIQAALTPWILRRIWSRRRRIITLQINKRQLENARDQTTKDSLTSTIANNEKQIGASLSSAYKDVLSSELAYEQAQAELSLQEKNTQIAQAQLAAGMITQKEYQDQENTLTNSQLAVQTAAMDLLEDMETYDWSVRGLAAAE